MNTIQLLERIADLEKAIQDGARLIEDTVPEHNRGLHGWLERPVVRAARGVASPDSIVHENPDGTPVDPFGPKDTTEARVFAEECFRVDVQVALHEHMRSRGVSAPELAKRMNIPEARVRAFFTDECNITVRDLGRFYYALGLPLPLLGPSVAARKPPPSEH